MFITLPASSPLKLQKIEIHDITTNILYSAGKPAQETNTLCYLLMSFSLTGDSKGCFSFVNQRASRLLLRIKQQPIKCFLTTQKTSRVTKAYSYAFQGQRTIATAPTNQHRRKETMI